MRSTKPLSKPESLCQVMTSKALTGGAFGLDVDFLFRPRGVWHVYEFLRCVTVRPSESNPRRYWRKNWRKFVALFRLAEDLRGELVLVNYETVPRSLDICSCGREIFPRDFGEVRILWADMRVRPGENKPLRTASEETMSFEQFSAFFASENRDAGLAKPRRG